MGIPIEVSNPFEFAREMLNTYGQVVDVGEWQGLRGRDTPQERTIEFSQFSLRYSMPEEMDTLQQQVAANQPWAEDHFQERVSGKPLNPGEQYKHWPWYRGNVEEHRQEVFTHTYMERYWPKEANGGQPYDTFTTEHHGIRYPYGDLEDVVSLLSRHPFTRQAYLPVWFPEDTGVVHGGRVPCSLGYHFLRRGEWLHCTYAIRSCDLFRHFQDDVYLTVRLVQWVIGEIRRNCSDLLGRDREDWDQVKPGELKMDIGSLHCFEVEKKRLKS